MTLKEQRTRVLLREREIKNLVKEGRTHAEIAERLGVTKQRIRNFLLQSKRRKPTLERISKLRMKLQEDRLLAKNKAITVYPAKRKIALDVLAELQELLSRSEFSSGTVSIASGESMLIHVNKIGYRIRANSGAEEAMSRVRAGVLSAYSTTMIRFRQFDRSKNVVGQIWNFTFFKS